MKRTKLEELAFAFSSPSEMAKPTTWPSYLWDHPELICLRNEVCASENTLLPMTLCNRIFAEFLDGCMENIEITLGDVAFANNLWATMTKHFQNENQRKEVLFSASGINEYFPNIHNDSDGPKKSDGTIKSPQGFMCLNIEVKNERGGGAGNPVMENIGYFIKQVYPTSGLNDKIIKAQKKYESPSLLLEIEGPWLGVSGIINTETIVYHVPLTPMLPFVSPSHELFNQFVCCLASIKRAVGALLYYYGNESRMKPISYDLVPYIFHEEQHENVRRITRRVFESWKGGINIVTKFARRYGKDVHNLIAELGFTPPLIQVKRLPGKWVQVEMEKWNNLQELRNAADKEEAKRQLRKIIDCLKENGYVHGDLRYANLFIRTSPESKTEKVVLLDFDWAGKNNEDTYPLNMNHSIVWPEGVNCGAKLMHSHDEDWLQRIEHGLQ